MWKLDLLVKLDHQAHAKLEEKKGRKLQFHKNREITVEVAREYKRVINSGNFAMLIEYCGERTLEGWLGFRFRIFWNFIWYQLNIVNVCIYHLYRSIG